MKQNMFAHVRVKDYKEELDTDGKNYNK